MKKEEDNVGKKKHVAKATLLFLTCVFKKINFFIKKYYLYIF